ncbi:MAG: Rrf2 family transcriptional regulator [Deltaproteobacteria bacterium]|nr:Rrf2 family transcriptional regulator [Deltaproteobacteria bacterium]
MRISTRGRYSLRMMLEIARFSDDETPISLQDVATWTGISRRYLEQLIIPLKAARLLRGRSGRAGGYSLTRQPAEIKVGEVLAAAMGPLSLVECVDQERVCGRTGTCECRQLWILLSDRVRDMLDEYSLADLADPTWLARTSRRINTRRQQRANPRNEVKS